MKLSWIVTASRGTYRLEFPTLIAAPLQPDRSLFEMSLPMHDSTLRPISRLSSPATESQWGPCVRKPVRRALSPCEFPPHMNTNALRRQLHVCADCTHSLCGLSS